MKLYNPPSALTPSAKELISRDRIQRRHRVDRWFQRGGLVMVIICLIVLFSIIGRLIYQGGSVLWRHEIDLPISFSSELLEISPTPLPMELREANTATLWHTSLLAQLSMEQASRAERRNVYHLVSTGADTTLTNLLLQDQNKLSKTESVRFALSAEADSFIKNNWSTSVTTRSYTEPLSVILDLNEKAGQAPNPQSQKNQSGQDLALTLNQPLFAAHIPARISVHEGITLLDGESESVFLYFNGGMVKLTQMAANTAKGKILIPFSTPLSHDHLNKITSWDVVSFSVPEQERSFKDRTFAALYVLQKKNLIHSSFNTDFFTQGDSRNPEKAGIWGAIVGSFLTLLVCLGFSFPVGVAAALYLEEFSRDSRLKRLLEVNINNLAAIPAIIYGLLGVAVFLNGLGLPRSAPLVGGLVLSLKTLPVIIISTRAALKAVPLSIRQAAWALGASPMQTVFHHVLPLGLPGIMTGTILGLSNALGETAPLLMIGMVAFIVNIPHWFTDAASVLPVQIYLWSDSPEQGFVEKTAAAILVLLVFMIIMNGVAILVRHRFEKRW
jgi:phosphate transport system permease protein